MYGARRALGCAPSPATSLVVWLSEPRAPVPRDGRWLQPSQLICQFELVVLWGTLVLQSAGGYRKFFCTLLSPFVSSSVPLVSPLKRCAPQQCDMTEEMRSESMDIIVSGVEKYADNMELACKMIKEAMDKKFGGPWHVRELSFVQPSHRNKSPLLPACWHRC